MSFAETGYIYEFHMDLISPLPTTTKRLLINTCETAIISVNLVALAIILAMKAKLNKKKLFRWQWLKISKHFSYLITWFNFPEFGNFQQFKEHLFIALYETVDKDLHTKQFRFYTKMFLPE